MTAAHLILAAASVVIAFEAVNKLARTKPRESGRTWRQQLDVNLKLAAWYLLALGAGGGVVAALLPTGWLVLQAACLAAGFALIIVRSRINEG